MEIKYEKGSGNLGLKNFEEEQELEVKKEVKKEVKSFKKKDGDKRGVIGGIVAIILFFIFFLMPNPEGLSVEGQRSLAVFVFALVMWISRPIPIYQTSILAILLLPMVNVLEKPKYAFETLGYEIIWLMVAAFVLSSAINHTNLGKRLALTLVTKLGTTPKGTLAAFVFSNFIIAFLVPSTTARAALFVPLVMVLLEVYKQVPGESKFGKLMTLQGIQNNAFATSMVMTATSSQVLAIGFINQMTGSNMGYMEWLMGSIPQAVFSAVVMFVIGYKIYKVEGSLEAIGKSKEILKGQLKALGEFSAEEKRVAIIFAFTILSWATGNYQEGWFGFGLSTTQTAVISMLLCLLPKFGVLTWKEADIKWDLMLFSAGAYAVGNAFNDTGGAGWLIGGLVEKYGIASMSTEMVAVILIFTTVFSHLVFTSKTVRTTILIPTVITLARTVGMDPVPIAMACSFGIAYTITLVPHSKVNALYFGTGYFNVLDQLKLGLLACFVGASGISILYFTWLQILY